MIKEEKIEKLKELSGFIRKTTLETIINAQSGHVGGNMSSVELLTVLYFGGLFNFDINNPHNENRDRVLIRGHEGPLRYTIFSILNYIDVDELRTYRQLGSRLQGHEDMSITPGVDITPSGSLGMILSYGVGSAIANKDKGLQSKTIVFLGDGEEQEGNVSEAARHASTLNLNNLICILDKNQKQLSRPTRESDGHDVKKIWEGYGWDVLEIENGNDVKQVFEIYKNLRFITRPTIVIANTIKGYGVIGAEEHYSGYHTLSTINDKNILMESYNNIAAKVHDSNSIVKNAKNMVSKPSNNFKKHTNFDVNLLNVEYDESKISPQVAHENYLQKIRHKTQQRLNMYYVTPDLYRKTEVEDLGYNRFMHFIDTGIREQHAIAMCHGISVENPDARICICFGEAFIYRAMDQINAAVMGNSNMTILGVWPGIEGGQNGKTHQTVSQPVALLGITGLNYYEPADSIDLYNVFSKIFKENKGVNYIRLSKEVNDLKDVAISDRNTDIYFVHKDSENPDILLVASGFCVSKCINVAKNLKKQNNISVNVVNVINPKAFSTNARKIILNNAPILCVYNGSPKILSQFICDAIISDNKIPRPTKLYSHGFEFGTSGKVSDLIKYYGYDEDSLIELSLKLLSK